MKNELLDVRRMNRKIIGKFENFKMFCQALAIPRRQILVRT